MRIPSGTVDQYIYFVAVDSTDFTSRETGLSSFTVYRSRNGAAATVYTTPTIAELSNSNMPGVYSLLLDEDMAVAAGNDNEEICFHITHAGMAPVTRVIELYRPKITEGETLAVGSGAVTTVTTTTTNTDMRGTDNAALASVCTNTRLAELDAANLPADVDAIKAKTNNLPAAPASTGDVAAVAAAIVALNDIAASDILTTQLVEAYNADGAAPTLTQAIMLILQRLTECITAGTTVTIKKLDGSTTAATLTLDDASNPTSVTRAS